MSIDREQTKWCPDTFIKAYWYASNAHLGQQTPSKPKQPYIFHVSTVAMEVCNALTAEDFLYPNLAVQCALLHDTIEDTAATYEDLKARFGVMVADGVQALTKDATMPKPQAMKDSLTRIKQQPKAVWAVKLADRITNLQPPPPKWSVEKRRFYCDEARVIHSELGAASPYLASRLQAKIGHYQLQYCSD